MLVPEISVADPNAESARATQEGAPNANKESNQEGVNASNKASLGGQNAQIGGSVQRDGASSSGQKMDDGNNGRDDNENKESGQRRSIISSIR